MVLTFINFLHRKKRFGLLCLMCTLAYFLKGFGWVRVRYHRAFRAYEFRVRGIVYLSPGPGWAFHFDYLNEELLKTFCHQYFPKEGDCIVDIGAGLGEEVAVFAQVTGRNGMVHALEANPVTHAGLKYLCNENNFEWVTPHNLAIFSREGTLTIEDNEENYLVNTIGADLSAGRKNFVVNATSLDALVKQQGISRIDFLKSNIEGAEQFLIEGMLESAGIVRNLCISCHDFRHTGHGHGEFYLTREKVKAFLKDHGFEITIRNTGDHVIDNYIYARNPGR